MKKIKRDLKEGYVTYFRSDIPVLIPEKIEEKDALRGVWVSTVANIDLPKMKDVASYKKHLDDIIKTVKEYKMNAVIFQVRPTNDAFYESELNPWSAYITGEQGKYPGFDVFGYFVEKAKKAGIEVHAWLNPYRVSQVTLDKLEMTKEEFLASLPDKSFAKQNPDLVMKTSRKALILDPASKKVQEFVSDTALEIAKKYDVKAIHMDDYFYPYEEYVDPNEEKKQYQVGIKNKSDFRRYNVTCLIKMMKEKLDTLDRKVEFGISPFGIYRTNTKYSSKESAWEYGSNNDESCFNCYEGLYADIYYWMEKGYIDYVVPQDYFNLDYYKVLEDGSEKEIVKYADLAKWWNEASKKTKTKLYIGMGLYRMGGSNQWANPDEIKNQLLFNSTLDYVFGEIFFTYHNLTDSVDKYPEAQKSIKSLWTKAVKSI